MLSGGLSGCWDSIKGVLQNLTGQGMARGVSPEGVTLALSFEGGGHQPDKGQKGIPAIVSVAIPLLLFHAHCDPGSWTC